jgi:aspartate/methionine/tyrosine aminotransferase
MSEVFVSNGATGVLAATIHAYCEDGGELVALEPAFLFYAPLMHVRGAKTRWVTQKLNLKTKKFEIDFKELESKFNSKTRILLLNNPGNPNG